MLMAIMEIENARDFFKKRVKIQAWEHLECMERRVSNNKPCPNARKLKEELGVWWRIKVPPDLGRFIILAFWVCSRT